MLCIFLDYIIRSNIVFFWSVWDVYFWDLVIMFWGSRDIRCSGYVQVFCLRVIYEILVDSKY